MKVMITVTPEVFTVIAGAVMAARRAPKLLQSQLEGGAGGDGLPPEAAAMIVKWASTVKPAAFEDSALSPETEEGGQAYFDQRAAEAIMQLLSAGGDPSALLDRLKESGRAP